MRQPISKTQGEENLGMAMTFTLVSHLRERLSELIRNREEQRKRDEMEKERLALEVSPGRSSRRQFLFIF